MRTVVPFSAVDPKTRLSDVLDPAERRAFARAMLADVLAALRASGRDPEVLATAPVEVDAPVTVDERSLDAAVDDVLATTDGPVAVVMADLPLATPEALSRLFAPAEGPASDAADVVLAPGRGGGTNAFVAAHPDFRVDYHGASIRDHRRIASEVGADLAEVDSYRLSTDVDERADLAEVLLHSEGRAADWLRDAGFAVSVTDDRATVRR